MASSSRKRGEEQKMARKPSSGKLPVAEPASFGKFCVILLMHVCKKVLLIDPHVQAGVYLCGVTLGSLVTDLVPPPRTYLSYKHNIFNVYLVKIGWGWTFTLVAIFIGLTSFTYCCGDKKLVKKHMSRLIVGTVWWYLCTHLFDYVEHITGFCGSPSAEHFNKRLCRKAGHEWIGFDISGHTFLLIYCLLLISEEVRCFSGWDRITEVIQEEEEQRSSRMTDDQFSNLKVLYPNLTPYVRAIVAVLTLLMIVWIMMLFSTVLYFHNMPQKLLGALFGIAGWFFTYQRWYKMTTVWSPGLPGQGYFKYKKE